MVCYLAALKLTSVPKVRTMVSAAIPRRTEEGRTIRDRRNQIQSLVRRDDAYHRRYFRLVKALYPVLTQQTNRLVKTFGWSDLLLRTSGGEINRNAYLKRLTHLRTTPCTPGLASTWASGSTQPGRRLPKVPGRS